MILFFNVKLSDLAKMVTDIVAARYKYKTVIQICNHPELSDEKVKAFMD